MDKKPEAQSMKSPRTLREPIPEGMDTLTIKQVRTRTGLSDVYIRRRITKGQWRAFKDHQGRNHIPLEDVEAWEQWRAERAITQKTNRIAAAEESAGTEL